MFCKKNFIFLFFAHSLLLQSEVAINNNYRKTQKRYQSNNQAQPNILILMVDEWRHPVKYQDENLIEWQRNNLKTVTFLQDNGVNFDNYYCGSTACNPGRATIFTGQYPSLHGVSQTTGAAKIPSDPTMYWLTANTVPTAGNFFLEGGYETYYFGKWHIADTNIYSPGSQSFVLSYDNNTGIPDLDLTYLYKKANLLSPFGFNNGWVGPEPEGNSPRQSGSSAAIGVSGRDVIFANQTISLLQQLNMSNSSTKPWLMVCSFVNPHDICLYGDLAKHDPKFQFDIDPSLPPIDQSPTANEDLSTKPIAQQSYKDEYQNVFQPTSDSEDYRKLYYSLQKNVDTQMGRILDTLLDSRFKDNTIVVFMSDHGSLVGAHGLFQKFFNIYEESIHIPLIFYAPKLLPVGTHVDLLTSHVDLLPTLCGLAGIDVDTIINKFQATFTDSEHLVGRDLSTIVLGTAPSIDTLREPLLFITYDQAFTGTSSIGATGESYSYVTQPSFINAIITKFDNKIWKLAEYYHNEDFDNPLSCTCSTPIQFDSENHAVEYEMYNITDDPYETYNLAHETYSTQETTVIQYNLHRILHEQLLKKALKPRNLETDVYR